MSLNNNDEIESTCDYDENQNIKVKFNLNKTTTCESKFYKIFIEKISKFIKLFKLCLMTILI